VSLGDIPTGHAMRGIVCKLLTSGMDEYHATRSVFTLMRELRRVCRCDMAKFGLSVADLDLKSSAPRAVLRLHQGSGTNSAPLEQVINDPALMAAIHPNRDLAKELTNSLIFLGSVDNCMRVHSAPEPPATIRDLEATLRLCATRAGEIAPDLLQACTQNAKPGKDPLGSLVFWSYIPLERGTMDATRTRTRGMAKVLQGRWAFDGAARRRPSMG
jgi:hypothetical protein